MEDSRVQCIIKVHPHILTETGGTNNHLVCVVCQSSLRECQSTLVELEIWSTDVGCMAVSTNEGAIDSEIGSSGSRDARGRIVCENEKNIDSCT